LPRLLDLLEHNQHLARIKLLDNTLDVDDLMTLFECIEYASALCNAVSKLSLSRLCVVCRVSCVVCECPEERVGPAQIGLTSVLPCRRCNFSIVELYSSLPIHARPEEQPKTERLKAFGCATTARNLAYRAYALVFYHTLFIYVLFNSKNVRWKCVVFYSF
jgi:hypothetical protein